MQGLDNAVVVQENETKNNRK